MTGASKALRGYDADYLLCRRGNLGHVWDVVGYWRAADGVVCRRLECARCESTRTDRWVRASGERLSPSYHYAEDYLIHSSNGDKPEASDVRIEAIRRANIFANEDAMLDAMTRTR